MLNNKSVLVTGGTGSFGTAFIKYVLKKYPKIKRLVIFSRDELKQYNLQQALGNKSNLRYFIGDVRDKDRLELAFQDIDFIVHAAALKQVPTAEYNPTEFIKTNIIGAQNIIEASLKSKVKKIVALSTDKASAPINLYGATKLCSDKLFIAANNVKGKKNINYSIVRYGNVMGSRGSVIPLFKKLDDENKPFTITSKSMTRFNITMQESINLVEFALMHSNGGEIFVPKIPSYRILDVAKAINEKRKIEMVGIRPGEKLHEDLITPGESQSTLDIGNYFIILPSKDHKSVKYFRKKHKVKFVKENFNYNSGTNSDFLTSSKLKKLIKQFS